MTPRPLPCGCVRGSYLCPVAERLWRASEAAWLLGKKEESWRLRAEYEAHFDQPTVEAGEMEY